MHVLHYVAAEILVAKIVILQETPSRANGAGLVDGSGDFTSCKRVSCQRESLGKFLTLRPKLRQPRLYRRIGGG